MIHVARGIVEVLFDLVRLAALFLRPASTIRVENLDGGEEMFPHIYGPVPLNAVTKTDRVPLSVGGRLVVDALVGGM